MCPENSGRYIILWLFNPGFDMSVLHINHKNAFLNVLPFLIGIMYFHYLFDKTVKVPIGMLVVFITLSVVFVNLVNKRRLPAKWLLLLGIVAIFALLIIISIPIGALLEGIEYENITTEAITGIFNGNLSSLKHIIPWYVTTYESAGQVLKGIFYNLTFPLMLLAFCYIFHYFSKNRPMFYLPFLKMLFAICIVNAIFNIVEFAIPRLHLGLLLLGGYGDGDSFFTFRALSLVLNVYVNSFLNLLLVAMSLNRFLMGRKIKWMLTFFFGFMIILISGTRVAMIAALLQTFVQILSRKFNRPSSKTRYVLLFSMILFLSPILLLIIKPDIFAVLTTIIQLKDPSGSAQMHLYYFLNSIDIILQFPFGIGIGKSDFGAFGTIGWIPTESHILALGVGAGFPGLILFLIMNTYLLYISNKTGNICKELHFIFPFGLGVFLISFINIQVFESLMPVTYMSLLYAMTITMENKLRSRMISSSRVQSCSGFE